MLLFFLLFHAVSGWVTTGRVTTGRVMTDWEYFEQNRRCRQQCNYGKSVKVKVNCFKSNRCFFFLFTVFSWSWYSLSFSPCALFWRFHILSILSLSIVFRCSLTSVRLERGFREVITSSSHWRTTETWAVTWSEVLIDTMQYECHGLVDNPGW